MTEQEVCLGEATERKVQKTWKLKQQEAKSSMSAVRNNEGAIVKEPKKINQVFCDFCKTLYTK